MAYSTSCCLFDTLVDPRSVCSLFVLSNFGESASLGIGFVCHNSCKRTSFFLVHVSEITFIFYLS
jgi:hypothetical protein